MNRYLTDLAMKRRLWHIPVGIQSLIFTGCAIAAWLEDSPADEDFLTWLFAYAVIVGAMVLPLFFIARWRLRQRNARIIAEALAEQRKASIPLEELDAALHVKNAEKKLRILKKCGFLQRIEISGGRLMLDNPAPVAPDESADAQPAADDITGQIRHLNDEINDANVSARIERLEHVTASIFRTIEERPDRADAARRFMNYYLPTTLKLLESYRLMEKQSYQGETIQASRRRIEQALELLVMAAEKQQDNLFRSEALDVDAEIQVLETMMASDGLLVSEGAPRA